ncbi:MAG: hypothetical protein NZ899_02650 [Thermoguttaceae bacterium]|nr:hypothetical protein [Thermoguttaceae bacterium]MDW8079775.1 hypothetical protein [Thermoguttaceae bacterium]
MELFSGICSDRKTIGQKDIVREVEADAVTLAEWVVNRFINDAENLAVPEIVNVLQFDQWRAEDKPGFFLILRPRKAKPDKFHALFAGSM